MLVWSVCESANYELKKMSHLVVIDDIAREIAPLRVYRWGGGGSVGTVLEFSSVLQIRP